MCRAGKRLNEKSGKGKATNILRPGREHSAQMPGQRFMIIFYAAQLYYPL